MKARFRALQVTTLIVAASMTHIAVAVRAAQEHETRDVKLEVEWSVSGDDVLFGYIEAADYGDDGTAYLLDSQTSQVLCISPTGDLIRVFGRAGEGPGEFSQPVGIHVTEDGRLIVLQASPARVTVFSSEGAYLTSAPLQAAEDISLTIRASDSVSGLIVLYTMESRYLANSVENVHRVSSLSIGDASLTTLFSVNTASRSGGYVDTEENRAFGPWALTTDRHLCLAPEYDGYVIRIWNSSGTEQSTIKQDYSPRRKTGDEIAQQKKFNEDIEKMMPGIDLPINPNDRDIRELYRGPEATILVVNSRQFKLRDETVLLTADVLTVTGDVRGEVRLLAPFHKGVDTAFISGDRALVITGNLSAWRAMNQPTQDKSKQSDVDVAIPEILSYRLPKHLD
ncbi:MAG TPA: 6-bladed beta-propeller [Candidatus Krumholzibacteria bacterium]|nr:6-bladed beta-propeller [Candidatus Krumholzibacteria bacterium]